MSALRRSASVAVTADREQVPWRAAVAHEDEVLRQPQALGVVVFHLALPVQLAPLARERFEHLDVEETGRAELAAHPASGGPKTNTSSCQAMSSDSFARSDAAAARAFSRRAILSGA
jgi:hypothetical protein